MNELYLTNTDVDRVYNGFVPTIISSFKLFWKTLESICISSNIDYHPYENFVEVVVNEQVRKRIRISLYQESIKNEISN